YKDSSVIKAACTENMTKEEACGASANEGTFCEEDADQGWLTTYACMKSTNNEDIVVISKFEMCDLDYGCQDDRTCE
ncbi:MAG: hypothetical protein J6A01_01095, partial [Proteobacteria bacterium]|nr:hypothetical protein [Pseudomonadota bacterium]